MGQRQPFFAVSVGKIRLRFQNEECHLGEILNILVGAKVAENIKKCP
jgi:hypothetical protein